MEQYSVLMQDIIDNGTEKLDRTRVGTIGVSGRMIRYDLTKGFPIGTQKFVPFESIKAELLWFISGSADRRDLQRIQHGDFSEDRFDIWKGNCLDARDRNSSLFTGYNVGEMYGMRWRKLSSAYHQPGAKQYSVCVDSENYVDVNDTFLEHQIRTHRSGSFVHKLWLAMLLDATVHGFKVHENWMNFRRFSVDIKSCKNWAKCFYDQNERYTVVPKFDTEKRYIGPTTAMIVNNVGHMYINDTIDQLQNVIDNIMLTKQNTSHSEGRRLIIDAWNPNHAMDAVLAICHPWVQFFVEGDKLSCMFTMRSNDVFLGKYFNVPSYALLTHIIANICDLKVGDLIYSGGDVHLYSNHIEQSKSVIVAKTHKLPTLSIKRKLSSIDELSMGDFELIDYAHGDKYVAKMAV